MTTPGYSAEASLYQTSRSYTATGSLDSPVGPVQPAYSSCRQVCGGDPDCMQCCMCIRRGGHPSQCCY